eukprot:89576-Pleurochrysis_carterae.AAC.1
MEKANVANDGRLVPCRARVSQHGRCGGDRRRQAWRTREGRDSKRLRLFRDLPVGTQRRNPNGACSCQRS